MRLYAIFLILNFQLGHIFAFPPNPLGLSSQIKHDPKGYECGNFFFTDDEVNEALFLGLNCLDKGYGFPHVYRGPLYSESKTKEYLLYPVKNGKQHLPNNRDLKTVFRIVFTRDSNEVVDVVAKITAIGFTKCFRRDGPYNGPSSLGSGNTNGYLCAHKFFSDDTIQESLALAQKRGIENTMYPTEYLGLLYPGQSGLLMWPIIKGDKLYKSGNSQIGPYFLILDRDRQFFDVVIRGYTKNILRCIRSRMPPTAPASDPFSQLFVPSPKSGYLCHKAFFDDNVLDENAEIVKANVGSAIISKYPEKYSGPPYNQRCLIWPMMRDGSLFKRGSIGPYRLILSTTYKVISVAMFVNDKFKECERTIAPKENHEISHYHCNELQFSPEQLIAAAEEACAKMKTNSRNIFPARYRGPRFKLDGPYLTYPVFGTDVAGEFKFKPGLHRVVINMSCDVVGALTQVKINNSENKKSQRKLVKCHRLADGPLPPGFFGRNAETVFEGNSRNKLGRPAPMLL